MGIDCHKPSSRQVIENTYAFQVSKTMFLSHAWMPFFDKFMGFDDDIALRFSRSYNGNYAKIGDKSFLVSEQSISQAIGLVIEGDRWFKKGTLTRPEINQLLKPEFHTVKLGKGFPRSYLIDKWQHVLLILQKIVIGEG